MQAESSPARPWLVTRWAVWSLPARVLTSLLLVEATALGLYCIDFARTPFTGSALLPAVTLVVLGVLHTEIAVGLERFRRRVADTPHVDLSSVWTFAAAILLSPALATGVVLLIFTHQWFRVWRSVHVPGYRHVFSTATVVLSCHAAAAMLSYAGGITLATASDPRQLLTLSVAILAYGTVNTGLVAAAIALSAPSVRPSPAQLLGHLDDNMLELGTLCLGALVALAMSANPWLVPLVLAPLLVLHRAVLVRQLEQVASTDSKTGLLNASAWRIEAARELRRAQRARSTVALLILDLDHFKSVNDDHGHLAGDEVLSAVASALSAEVREHDLVGRFGGEEFVVLLPQLGAETDATEELHIIAERIRHRVATMKVVLPTSGGPLSIGGLSVSVGCAAFPDHGSGLDQVLAAADTALYAVKRDGRNAVRIAELPALPRQRSPGWR